MLNIESYEIHGVNHVYMKFKSLSIMATNVNYKDALLAAYAKLLNEMWNDKTQKRIS